MSSFSHQITPIRSLLSFSDARACERLNALQIVKKGLCPLKGGLCPAKWTLHSEWGSDSLNIGFLSGERKLYLRREDNLLGEVAFIQEGDLYPGNGCL